MTRLRRVSRNPLFLTGLILFAVGSGPLLLVIAAASLGLTSDPNPNPVGFGIMAFFTFWPSIALMAIGLWRAGRSA